MPYALGKPYDEGLKRILLSRRQHIARNCDNKIAVNTRMAGLSGQFINRSEIETRIDQKKNNNLQELSAKNATAALNKILNTCLTIRTAYPRIENDTY